MSNQSGYENYSQINLNAIKNTKLFQKFMQNKSGLISSGSANNIINPRASQNEKVPQVKESKWVKNQNRNKAISMSQNLQSFNQKQQFNPKQQNSFTKNPYQQVNFIAQKNPQFQTIENNTLQRQEYQRSQKKTQYNRNFPYETVQQKVNHQKSVTVQQNSNPIIVPNRRKRNFNPNFQSSKNNTSFQEQKSLNVDPYQFQRVSDNNFKANDSKIKSPQKLPEDSLQMYNTVISVQQKNYLHPEQKLAKTQLSPSRNVYPHNYSMADQKVNSYEQNFTSTNVPPVISQGEYKQKYESLLRKYEELKQEVKNENKNRKKQFTEWQHEIDLIKQKLFDVQSREDSLLIENQRWKQKWENENLLKMKTQQENKQLGYKIKELQDQINMKQTHMKQRFEETNYWKNQSDAMKQELHSLKLVFQKRNDEYNLLYGDYQIVKKERDNKDYLLEDLRKNINFLVEQNSAAKDQIFKLVTKLYQLQQENQMLKNDLKRQSFDNSQLNNYMKDLQQQNRDRIQSTNVERHHERPHERQFDQRVERPIHKNQSLVKDNNLRNSLTQNQRPNPEKQPRRRGQFARQRGQLVRNERAQRDERPPPTNQNIHNQSVSQQRQQNQVKQPQFTNNKIGRINQILQELQKIKDMKAMNGAIRRRKIDLERQLQELEAQ